MVGVFGFELAIPTIVAFGLGLGLGVLIGIVARVEYRSVSETRSKRNQQITQRVIQPLYDEVSNAAEGDLPRSGTKYRSYWESLEAHQRVHVGTALQPELNDYAQKLKRVNILDSDLADVQDIRQSLPYGMLETRVTDGDSTVLLTTPTGTDEGVGSPLEEFLVEYGSLIVNSMSAEELHRNLSETELEPFVAAWDEAYPDWEEAFLEAFQRDDAALVEAAQERQQLLTSEIPEHASRIRDELEPELSRRSTPVPTT